MSGLAWKFARIRAMGMREIAYRLRRAAQAALERSGYGHAQPGAPSGEPGKLWLPELPRVLDVKTYRSAADRILAGHFDIFAMEDIALGFPPEWNRDPKTGQRTPLVFGKRLNYRDERIVGDIKYLWELNRHDALVTLAQAWHLTMQERYRLGFVTLVDSWIRQCPYPLGANWASPLEHAVRLINWAVAWHLLRKGGAVAGSREDGASFLSAEAGTAFRRRWLDSIYHHCHFIAGNLSRYSSANNHLLGELVGLFIASVTWPMWPESARWRKEASIEIEVEALKQTAMDGVNREQALWYHHEVADMMLLAGLFGRANGHIFGEHYWRRLESMLDFIAAMMDVGGGVPMIGDADDALIVRFCRAPGFNVYRSLLATGAVLFARADFAAKATRFDDKSRWLLGDEGAQRFARLNASMPVLPPRRAFPDGGYWILGCDFGTEREIRAIADAGPLGYLSIAAHGHADALAFTLSVGGREVLVDAGTYAYHTNREWRDYFRGTSAHNTVRVDGVDQSVIGGDFLWTRHARGWIERWEPGDQYDHWKGAHDGYRRLRDPVLHRRCITINKRERVIEVTDSLECAAKHDLELFWHFAAHCTCQVEGCDVVVRAGPTSVKLSMPGSVWAPQIVTGQHHPPLGWISRAYDKKVPSPTAVWRGRITGTTELRSLIRVLPGPETAT